MKRWRLVFAGLGVSLVLVAEAGWSQAPAPPPSTSPVPTTAPRAGGASGGHTAGVGAEVPPETPAKDLTPKQNEARMAAWRAEIRKILYVPDKLPALEPKTWSTFS